MNPTQYNWNARCDATTPSTLVGITDGALSSQAEWGINVTAVASHTATKSGEMAL